MPDNPLQVLGEVYKLTPPQIFYIIWPSLKPIHELSKEEFLQIVDQFKAVYDDY